MGIPKENAIIGSLLGAAIGDAAGLPMEGLSRRRQSRLYSTVQGYHLLFHKGMVSDDTEHICMVAQALMASGGDEEKFAKDLAWRMRKWFLCLPAGIGFATLRSMLKLCLGFSPHKSGVFSAGNGPAMRSAIIGVCYGDDKPKLKNLVRISTRITHTDPKAEWGALAVALAAHLSSRNEFAPEDFFHTLENMCDSPDQEFLDLTKKAIDSVSTGQSTQDFAASLGLGNGVSGYMYHTFPVVLHAWFRNSTALEPALIEMIRCGGDTDTTASILGGIVGAGVGKEGIPPERVENLWEWFLTPQWIESLGKNLALAVNEGRSQAPPRIPFFGSLVRNLFFMIIILSHGFRRLFPPY
ncbi:MAG: ADP-ribosylglycohydrolase family protein [Desulfobacteraceae bacterium]|nr:ADP-ribosylglycohydrolase family protein [Desulfobacteraceae bacterium]